MMAIWRIRVFVLRLQNVVEDWRQNEPVRRYEANECRRLALPLVQRLLDHRPPFLSQCVRFVLCRYVHDADILRQGQSELRGPLRHSFPVD